MYINNQKFMVLGISKSGYAVAKKILTMNGKCYLYEDKKSGRQIEYINELVELGAEYVKRENFEEILNLIDVLIISPGVPINHEVAVKAKRVGVKIIGEVEFGFRCLMPSIIAVTGTNGKTTTCSMIEKIFSNTDKKAVLVGNVGVPVTSMQEQIATSEVCITEISSFQLETVMTFCPHVSCILNIAPDHLERHYTMDNYIYLKKRIFKNQKQSEYTVLNYDDEIIRNFANEVDSKIVWISLSEEVAGCYLKDTKLYYFSEEIMNVADISVGGNHNIYNALFAIAVCKLYGIDNQTIAEGIKAFKGVKHRIQEVGDMNGVKYFDDSKGTNVASTITAIESMKRPTILILGGSEKGESYDNLFKKIKNSCVRHVVLTGDSRFNMLESAGRIGVGNLTLTKDFVHAVKIAQIIAEDGENVLLSPACASFDYFKNYEERGDAFSKIAGINNEKN